MCDNSRMNTQEHPSRRPLVIGYGNPHRQDDRIGHVVADALQRWADDMRMPLDVVTAYQLDLDMAEQIGTAALVVFIDAHRPEFSDNLACTSVVPDSDAGFTTHAFTPGSLLSLVARLTGSAPKAFIVSVPGYSFDMGEEISERTRALAGDAVALVQKMVMGT